MASDEVVSGKRKAVNRELFINRSVQGRLYCHYKPFVAWR
ncbi:hypothetical protein HMPREF1991_01337 [Hoylesella loescheii DSM 19665 = JCM 12249 = ATCC 15930]|uniref:Uncharacterized protein n=1 Tax=Hoylesella loescheii DSM 19665 = JCM 12249 = ATCC 15930 TaxID=1122985 RepID=A0A069QRW2_HOYLO|nr:hypothetical protein HMPREF1991_01337 [Hoylesella loescheii DSM 19665 = JCM 12249 = ATCC 15930]